MNKLLAFLLTFATSTAVAQDFPKVFNTEPLSEETRLSPERAASSFQVPNGFQVDVFASEPDVQNPIAMAWDAKGRLWIAENYTYAERSQRFQLDLRDRVLIFDNTSGPRFKTRKVFTENVQMLTGLEVGKGGVWLMCPPKLIFIPDTNGDDVPDDEGTVVLDGFTVAQSNYHNFANGLKFGPDGWLYGRCGGSCPGRIGTPGTPDAERLALEGGIWRYHPERKTVEVLTSGTTNPWGHDWNAVGELFYCNTVNGHLWHMIPGAHFTRPFLLDPNRRTYKLIDFHADHWHFDTGQSWTKSRDGAANEFGGGHAHIGTMIYQGQNWPEDYRGKLFTINQHGRRTNQEILKRQGSGYVAQHGKDILVSDDPWFQGIDLSVAPDGSVFVIDWSDTGECHEHTGVHRESGRIYRVSHRDGEVATADEANIDRFTSPNPWVRKQALLAAAGEPDQRLKEALLDRFRAATTNEQAVQLLFALHATQSTDQSFLIGLLNHPLDHVRAWAIRLITERWPLDDTLGPYWVDSKTRNQVRIEVDRVFETLCLHAGKENSALVRLVYASTLQRLPVERRAQLAKKLVVNPEDANDHNLPMMIWYGLIPVANEHADQLAEVAAVCRLPDTLRCIARCMAEEIENQPIAFDRLISLVAQSKQQEFQKTILDGVSQGLSGRARAPQPKSWNTVTKIQSPQIAAQIRELSVIFGDGRALDELKQVVLGKTGANYSLRLSALETLIYSDSPELREICEVLLKDSRLSVAAAKGLARFNDPKIGELIVSRYRNFRAPFRPQIMSILASQKSFAIPMLEAIGKGKIPRSDLSAFQVRQIHGFGDTQISQRLREVWGEIRDTPAEKQNLMKSIKQRLTEGSLADANKSVGRALFAKHCQTCHRLYGEGGKVGPDITGANRNNIDYLLSNIVDPSAVVDKDYRMTRLLLEDGRNVNGLVMDETDQVVTVQTATESVKLPKADIVVRKVTENSPMPEGLLDTLGESQIRDLFAYLMHATQVDLPSSNR